MILYRRRIISYACQMTFFFSPFQKYYLISKLQWNAIFYTYSTYLGRIFLMLGISSALFVTNLHIREYYMLHFATFRSTEVTKMNVHLQILYTVISTLYFKPTNDSCFTYLSRTCKRFGIYNAPFTTNLHATEF